MKIRDFFDRLRRAASLSPVDRYGGRAWISLFDGSADPMAWQKDVPLAPNKALAHFAVYACVSRIAQDISKLCLGITEHDPRSDIWSPINHQLYSRIIRRPNHFQNAQQFVESWILSKAIHGNTLALKERDEANRVVRQYVLDWARVTPLVSESGDVFYDLAIDDLAHIHEARVVVPASEVVHDRMNCFFHPLVGVSPLFAGSMAAKQGNAILRNSETFFKNLSRPGGLLTGPNRISDETAKRLKLEWDQNYGPGKQGKTAVLGDGLKYEGIGVTPENAQLVDQLKLSATMIATIYHVPLWKIGLEPVPSGAKVQDLNQIYYSDCLQSYIEAFERCQDEALALDPMRYRTEFDLDDLLRMDTKTQAEVEGLLVQRGIAAPNESRRRFGRAPVVGGDTPYLQQQNYSLAALNERDTSGDPFGSKTPPAPPPADPDPPEGDETPEDEEQRARRVAEQVSAAVLSQLELRLDPMVASISTIEQREAARAASAEADRVAVERVKAFADVLVQRIEA